MAYWNVKRTSDGAMLKCYVGKISGVKYTGSGSLVQIDRNNSLPVVEYLGTPLNKLVKDTGNNDTLTFYDASGNIIATLELSVTTYPEIVNGVAVADGYGTRITKLTSSNTARVYSGTFRTYQVQASFSKAFSYQTSATSVNQMPFNNMLLYDFENEYLFRWEENILTLTGGIQYDTQNSPVQRGLPFWYGIGKRGFSAEKMRTASPPKKNGYTHFSSWDEEWVANIFYNSNDYSEIGQSMIRYPAYRNTSTGAVDIQGIVLMTNKLSKNLFTNSNDDNEGLDDNDEDKTDDPKGTGDDSTDPTPRPPQDPTGVLNTLLRAYSLTQTQLQQLVSTLWSDDFFQNLMNVLTAPIDTVIQLYMIQATPVTFGKGYVQLGNVVSNIEANIINQDTIRMLSDNIFVPLYYGNYHDYQTKVNLYLPYYGEMTLPAYVLGNTINVEYDIDILSGMGLITIGMYAQGKLSVIKRVSCNCAYQLPLSARDTKAFISGLWTSPIETLSETNKVQNGKLSPNISHMDVHYPYLILERKNLAIPNNYPNINGGAIQDSGLLKDFNGYTKVKAIQLNIPNCTEIEQQKILNILMNEGVII